MRNERQASQATDHRRSQSAKGAKRLTMLRYFSLWTKPLPLKLLALILPLFRQPSSRIHALPRTRTNSFFDDRQTHLEWRAMNISAMQADAEGGADALYCSGSMQTG
jgi:hypothetical protein